jgi:transketolase
MRDAVVRVLHEMAGKHPEIILLTGDLGFGVLTKFKADYPRQFVNVGVAEQNMTALAAGLALEDYTVFTYSIGNFPTLRCLEQIRNDICYHNANVKVICVGGGMSYGAVGMSHHATEDIAILRSLAGIEVYTPCDLWEAEEIARHLIRHKGPAYLRLDKSAAPETRRPDEVFVPGAIRTVLNGSDVTIAAAGGILGEALIAAELLAKDGIQCRILSVSSIKPLDVATLRRAAQQTGGILTLEEHTVDGGLGGAIAEALMEADERPGFFVRMGLRNTFSSIVGSQMYLRKQYGLDAASVAAVVKGKIGVPAP